MQHPQQRMILRPDRNRQQDTEPLAVIIQHAIIHLPFPYPLSCHHHHQSAVVRTNRTQKHTFMPQLAIRELRARLDPREDLPAQAAKVVVPQLAEAIAQLPADLHLERLAG